MAQNVISIVQLVVAVLMSVAILLQQKGSGIGAAYGGGSVIYSTKRGVEKVLFYATIVLAVLFFACGLLSIVLR